MRMIKEKSERISPGSHDVLRLLYENDSMRQSDIARILGITKSACNQHCRRLVNARFSSAENGTATRGGRPGPSPGTSIRMRTAFSDCRFPRTPKNFPEALHRLFGTSVSAQIETFTWKSTGESAKEQEMYSYCMANRHSCKCRIMVKFFDESSNFLSTQSRPGMTSLQRRRLM